MFAMLPTLFGTPSRFLLFLVYITQRVIGRSSHMEAVRVVRVVVSYVSKVQSYRFHPSSGTASIGPVFLIICSPIQRLPSRLRYAAVRTVFKVPLIPADLDGLLLGLGGWESVQTNTKESSCRPRRKHIAKYAVAFRDSIGDPHGHDVA